MLLWTAKENNDIFHDVGGGGGVEANVLVISLDQPVVAENGTDGLGGPTQSNSPVGDK